MRTVELTERIEGTGGGRAVSRRSRRGFSLMELTVVVGVTIVLTGLLMPALLGVKDRADRLMSASHMRQHGMGFSMYSSDTGGRLPTSALLWDPDRAIMREMMATFIDPHQRSFHLDQRVRRILDLNDGWEGYGLLYGRGYVDVADVFYCPSHRGDHPLERYQQTWLDPEGIIYSNYHYRGDYNVKSMRRFSLANDPETAFLTDGMRSKRDFNHRVGFNSLLGDGSVHWQADTNEELYSQLPDGEETISSEDLYNALWGIIEE